MKVCKILAAAGMLPATLAVTYITLVLSWIGRSGAGAGGGDALLLMAMSILGYAIMLFVVLPALLVLVVQTTRRRMGWDWQLKCLVAAFVVLIAIPVIFITRPF
jgi:hypothetical protein